GKKNEAHNRVQNARNKAKRDAGEEALSALIEKTGKKRAPEDVKDAKFNVIYAKLNYKNGQQPYLCMRKGNRYEEACPCGRFKNYCVKCNSVKMYGRKRVCKGCNEKGLDGKAVRDGKMLCATCE
ncbi:MAG: hypothetical protein VW891_07155, partial [Novosphingobium sp.]